MFHILFCCSALDCTNQISFNSSYFDLPFSLLQVDISHPYPGQYYTDSPSVHLYNVGSISVKVGSPLASLTTNSQKTKLNIELVENDQNQSPENDFPLRGFLQSNIRVKTKLKVVKQQVDI